MASIIERSGDYVSAFVEPHSEDSEDIFMGKPIIDESQASDKYYMALGIGNFKVRRKLMDKFEFAEFPPIIDPSAVVLGTLGAGVVVCPMAFVGVDTNIGRGTIVNTNASIDHDCKIGEFVNINPNVTLCGGVGVWSDLYIAAGKTILPNEVIYSNVKFNTGKELKTKDE